MPHESEGASSVHTDDPDPRVLWRWAGDALRPWLGWILIGAGALLMLLGYLGVSREALPTKQIPYLVSGGIGGMFVAVLGAYFLGTQELRKDSGRLDRLEQMVEDLHHVLLRRPDAPDLTQLGDDVTSSQANGAAANGTSGTLRRVLIVDGGGMFHRPGCSMTEGKDSEELSPATARKRGLRPCPVCAPTPATTAH